MKKRGILVVFLTLICIFADIFGQDSAAGAADDFFDGNIDSLFDDVPEDDSAETPPSPSETENPSSTNNTTTPAAPNSIVSAISRIGFSMDASFNFAAGYLPGWKKAPWYWESETDRALDNYVLAKMESKIALDIQVSDILRVRQAFSITIPSLALTIPEFFFDYNLLNFVFFRAGKYALNWGISPNFPYTNLPSRIPNNKEDLNLFGDLYILRADIPLGIGGFQLAAMTRSSVLENLDSSEDAEEGLADKIYLGLKYNAAVPIVDVNVGFLYNTKLDTKAFVSLKTTLFNQLELYSEALISYNFYTLSNFAGSGSLGLMQEFFNNQLSINAELYYNGEANATYINQNSNFLGDTDPVNFIRGFNTVLNIRYKPNWLKHTEFFLKYLHGFDENTVQLVPGFRLTALSNFNLYVALPMALGNKDGYYYKHNVDEKNRPFSVVVMLTFSGNYRYSNR